ncbi:MAG: chorismate mutase [Oscillospiraceae bacterium]|nr:chorismate mutase [Oscillospiraceae bacterium]
MELKEAREQISRIDEEMASLFLRRMEAAGEIAAYKRERGLPIEDKEQEARVIEAHSAGIEDEALRSLYVRFLQSTMDVSKRWQQRLISGMPVAYCGVEGAFACIAAKRIFPDGVTTPFATFEKAYRAVEEGVCEAAVLPIENSYAGEVGQVIDLMFAGSLHVNGVYDLPVRHHLLGVPGARQEDVRRVVSHPQALDQCVGYLQEHGYETVSADNTAIAAQQVAQLGDVHTAAIASRETAALYGLKVLDHDVHESRTNTTRFAVFSRVESRPPVKRDGTAFLLLFTVNDEAGGLARAVNVISAYDFNMRVLRSRPMKELPWHYYFYTEVEGDDASENGRRMINALKGACPMVKVVGHYTAAANTQQGGESI